MGYMWIGTSMGLSRFSGSSFKSYKFSEHNEGIVDLLSDLNGFYALESSGNILKYDYEKDRINKLNKIIHAPALSFDFIDEETLIIGLQQGLIIFNTKFLEFSDILSPESLFNRKVLVKDSKLYVASTNGIDVYGLNKSKPTIIHEKTYLNGIEVLDIAFDNEKRIWAGTNQNGLYIVDGDNAEKINILKTKPIYKQFVQ